MKNPSFCWNHSYTSTELYVTRYSIVWSTDTENDMGTKLGRYFAEGNSTNIKYLTKTMHDLLRSQMKIYIIYIKDETIIYSTKYVTTYLGYQICSVCTQLWYNLITWYVCKRLLHVTIVETKSRIWGTVIKNKAIQVQHYESISTLSGLPAVI